MKKVGNEIGFGGGCHWCTEAVFKSVKGVISVRQGYLSSQEDCQRFSEGVIINYNSDCVKLETLIEIHLISHKSGKNHSMREKYRSAIYTYSDLQKREALMSLEKVSDKLNVDVVTKILDASNFVESRDEIKDYYYKNPAKPFCRKYIDPKLKMLLQTHQEDIKIDQLTHLL